MYNAVRLNVALVQKLKNEINLSVSKKTKAECEREKNIALIFGLISNEFHSFNFTYKERNIYCNSSIV